MGDINNDGWPDVVLTNTAYPGQNLYVLLNNQHGGFTSVPTNFGESTTQAILADLNGDGNLDLIVSPGGGAQVYLGDGSGHFTFQADLSNSAPYYFGTGPAPTDLLPVNLHGQAAHAGVPDIVTTDEITGVVVLLNLSK